jgi:uncharacterized protein YecT (DUF1311 family)
MRFAGPWLFAVSTLALAACHPARPAAARAAASRPAVAKAVLPAASSAAQRVPIALAGAARPSSGDKATPGPAAGSIRRRSAEPAGAVDLAHHARNRMRAAGGSEARRAGSSAEYAACLDAADGFTVAIANCYSAELARQGARLNRAYEAALAADSGVERESLAQEQRAWTMALSLHTGIRRQEEAAGGGSDLLREGRCRLDLTIQRAVQLERRAG